METTKIVKDDWEGTEYTTYFQEDNTERRTVKVCRWKKYNQIEVSISICKKEPTTSRSRNSSFSLKGEAFEDFKKFINQKTPTGNPKAHHDR